MLYILLIVILFCGIIIYLIEKAKEPNYSIEKIKVVKKDYRNKLKIPEAQGKSSIKKSLPLKLKLKDLKVKELKTILKNEYSEEFLKNNFSDLVNRYNISKSSPIIISQIFTFELHLSSSNYSFKKYEITRLFRFIDNLSINDFQTTKILKTESGRVEYNFSKWKEDKVYELDSFLNVFELVKEKKISEINYSDLLQCFEWKVKRFKILFRDNFECQKCNHKSENNHVHHKYYLKNKLPWDIEDGALITLCESCHYQTHKSEKILTFEEKELGLKEVVSFQYLCGRCNGSGHLPQYNYHEGGVCFKCNGNSFSMNYFERVLNNVETGKYNTLETLDNALKFIESITYNDFKATIPNINKYKFSKVRQYYDEDEDLPF